MTIFLVKMDMALSIELTGIARDSITKGESEFIASMPTIILLSIGAVIGGLIAAIIEKDMQAKKAILSMNDLKTK